MRILGIHDGHTSSACLVEDGEIKSLVSEERFTYIKNQGGFPKESIKYIFNKFNISGSDIDAVIMASLMAPIINIDAYNTGRHKFIGSYSKYIPNSILSSSSLKDFYVNHKHKQVSKSSKYNQILSSLGIDKSKIEYSEHHESHASTAFFLDPSYNPDQEKLIFTLDGSGDGLSATVSIGKDHKMERLAEIPTFDSLGMLYSRMTQFLGMKPLEHEYKLMGMAPYAPKFLEEKSYEVLKQFISLDDSGLYFKNTSGVWGAATIKKFQKLLVTHRFDGISAGLQRLTEELVIKWVKNWIHETGVNDIAVAGGVFMNVKVNMLLNEDPDINSIFFMPSCGDESIAAGAAIKKYVDNNLNNNVPIRIKPLKTLYLGPEYTNTQIEEALSSNDNVAYEYVENINDKIVDLLANRKNIARFNGKMEFGARSLGNRSILARPDDWECVRKINKAIKMRDFWMPFAPTILDSATNKYLKTNGSTFAPYMILGFNSTETAENEILAGLHQSDQTCRPQILEKDWNPSYYDIIEKFSQETGISGVLNTSFNIHGYPIVNTPKNAIWTLENSELDALQLGPFLVTRK